MSPLYTNKGTNQRASGRTRFDLEPQYDDDNPSRFYEPSPSGPYKGKSANRANVRKNVHEYYEQAGWDDKGIPKSETLSELGLDNADNALKKLRGKI